VETVDIDLSDAVFAQIKLAQLPQFLQVLDFHDFVVCRVEDLQLFKGAVLQAVQVLQLIARDVKELKVGHSVETPFEVAVLLARLHEQGFDSVFAKL